MSNTKKSVITAMCIALCVVLPLMFHMVRNAGSVLCPMHIPVLLCGLICGGYFGMFCGMAGPLASCFMTGMPPVAILPGMTTELAVYGLITGLMMRTVRTGKIYADLYISLVSAMLAGRIIGGVTKALIFSPAGYSMAIWTSSYFVTSFPGIVVQIALIPSILFALEKAGVIPGRYPKAKI